MARSPASLTVPWAEQLGAGLPPLLVEAERVASTVMPGLHGRRRAGPGEAFWQFRPYVSGDQASRIDWRQSGKSDRLFVRETEWEAAQTVALWAATGPGMDWRSSKEGILEQARDIYLALRAVSDAPAWARVFA